MSESAVTIHAYHAHVYFDAETLKRAISLCETARDTLDIQMGRVHQKPVGPHSQWSCQLTIPTQRIGELLPWLILNRDGLTIFLHPETGDPLADHSDHVVWLGESKPLKLDQFL